MTQQKSILTILGARPQFIKAAVVSKELRARGRIREILVHTGQHYDANMSDVFFEELGIPSPDYNLAIGSGRHGDQTGRMLIALEPIVLDARPDAVMVYGDTNSTLAGALVAAKLDLPLIHVEAGLRSFNRAMPEEVNRVATDALSTLLLAPTRSSAAQLRKEGVEDDRIVVTGDVMFDAAIAAAQTGVEAPAAPYFLATIHRAENTDAPDRLRWIMEVLGAVGAITSVVFPVHPRTRAALDRLEGLTIPDCVVLKTPVGYQEMMGLVKAARAVLTDSGGLQKEAFYLGRPIHIFRNETEWQELVDTGWADLVRPEQTPTEAARAILARGERPGRPCDVFGDGQAGRSIVDAIEAHLGL